jgi:7-cyano-7-deazaguanine synthase
MKRAIVLVSGGMDSAVTAALAAREFDLAFLHVDYGQKTERKERESFLSLVDHFHPTMQKIITMAWLGEMGGSALTDSALIVPSQGIDLSVVPVTYVPFRNTLLLSAAVAWAEVIGAEVIMYGAVEVDGSGYPDCRIEFVEAFNRLVQAGSARGKITISAPLIAMSKQRIVNLGITLGAPFDLTWSCYGNSEEACGTCDSCRIRLAAFQQAGIPDPIPYRSGMPGIVG